MRTLILAMAMAVALALVACDAEQSEPTDRDTSAQGGRVQSPPGRSDRNGRDTVVIIDTTRGPARPPTKTDTISVEGYDEPIAVKLVGTDLYSTYYPAAEMIVEQSSADEGTGLRFIANFAGKRTDSAFLHIFTPNDPKVGPDEAREILLDEHGIVRTHGWTANESKLGFHWALETYRISGPGAMTGFACVGVHRGRGFVVIGVYPAEFGDGMGPRIAYILDELIWNDTRTGLEGRLGRFL